MKSYVVIAIVAMVCLGLNVALAQVTQLDILASVTVGANPLTINSGTDFAVDGLAAGQAYAFVPDPAGSGAFLLGANPGLSTQPTGTVGSVTVTGDGNSTVLVSFALPSVLYPSGTGPGVVHMSYNGTSGAWGLPGAILNYFDPRVPTEMTLNADGTTGNEVAIGGIVTIANNSFPDTYVGDIIMTVAYVGN